MALEEMGVRHQQVGNILCRKLRGLGPTQLSSKCSCSFGHASRDLDMAVHGDDFFVAGSGEDLDWPPQKMNDSLELVQKTRRNLVINCPEPFV